MTDLEPSPYEMLLNRFRSARSDLLRADLARRIVQCRWERGDYSSVIHGELTADLRELLARQLVREKR